MRPIIASLLLTFSAPALAGAAEPTDPVVVDAALSKTLSESQASYDAGLRALQNGDAAAGRAGLERAFVGLVGTIEDPALAAELKADFGGMVDKVRAWEGAPAETEPAQLDAPSELLQSASAALKLDPDHEVTKKYIELYTGKRRSAFEEALGRSGRYRAIIDRELEKAGLPRELFFLAMAESEYRPLARSRVGAAGLWQFMPATARKYGLEVSFWVDERYEPEKATAAAMRYLSDLHRWFGDWPLAIAAYNRGENGIGRDLASMRATDFFTLRSRGAMPSETRHYVPKFMACAILGRDPAKFGLKPRYEEPEQYEDVPLARDLSLAVAAKAAEVPLETIRRLNPALRVWATPPNRPGFVLRVPRGTGARLTARLAELQDWNPGPDYVRYRVQRGDFLGKIAKRHRTTVKAIMTLNSLRSARHLRPGMILKVQAGKGYRP